MMSMVIESAANIINFSLIPQVFLLIFEDNLHKNLFIASDISKKTENTLYFKHLQNNISIKGFNDSASIFYYFSASQRGFNRRS